MKGHSFHVQSPLVIVDPVTVEFLVIVDRFSGPIVYFSMYFSCNSGITHYSGHFATDGRIHYYERRLYLFLLVIKSKTTWITKNGKIDKLK